MAKNLLSAQQIKHAKPKNDRETLLNDGEGLYLRVRSNGSLDWFFIYTFDGKRIKLGIDGSDTPKVREKAETYRKQLADGINPKQKLIDDELAKKEAEKLARQARLDTDNRVTVKVLFERWEKLDLSKRKDNGKEIRRMFEKDVLPAIGHMPVEDVKKGHVIAIVDALLTRGVDRMAKMMLSLMRQMFRFAQDRDIIENDPTATIRKAKIGKPDTERDRVLSEEEIRALSAQMPNANLSKTTEAAIWIALSTGCRIGELLQAKWQDVDLEKCVWTIPPENSKNGEPLTVQFSQFTLKHFQALQSINHQTPWCYPDRKGKNHVCTKTITKQITDRQLQNDKKPMSNRSKHAEALKLSGGKWTCHDLRRTAGTLMTALGVLPDIADKCLNHKEQNRIRRTYLRHSYDAEKREAWKLLGERLELLTTPEAINVILGKFGTK